MDHLKLKQSYKAPKAAVNGRGTQLFTVFNNACTYNQEGSWVYIDVEEMEMVFNTAFECHITNAGFQGSSGGNITFSGTYNTMDDNKPLTPCQPKSANQKTGISNINYSSDNNWFLFFVGGGCGND